MVDRVTLQRARAPERLTAEANRDADTFLRLIEDAPFGVYLVDASLRIVTTSAGAAPVFAGVGPVIGRRLDDILRQLWPEPFASEAIGRFEHTLATGEPFHSLDTTERRADTSDLESYDWQTMRVTMPDGQPGVVCYFYDLTPIRRAAAAMRASAERERRAAAGRARAEVDRRQAIDRYEQQARLFEGVASTTPDFVYVFDLTGRFVYANRRLLEVWGVTLEHAIGRTPRELGYEQWHHDMHMREIAEVVETRRPIKGEVPFTAPLTGIYGVYEYIFTPVLGVDGQVELIAGTTRDVTERKSTEQALTRALAARDEFLGLVSHELRTPLTIILGMSRILASGGTLPVDRREIAADIAESAEVLSDIVEAMLLLARLDRREAGQLLEPVLLDRAAASVLDRVHGRDGSHGYRLDIIDPGSVVETQQAWIELVIENLVTNAAKYSQAASEVTVEIRREGPMALCRVLDRGPGVPEEELDRLFEPFYRSAATRGSVPGAGLGLAVAKRIVDLAGGSMWVRAREGGGSEFGFSLPIAHTTD